MSKDQFVIACVESVENAAIVLPWARHFAECLNHKGLMMLHISKDLADDSWLKALDVPYVSMHGNWQTAIEGIPTAFNGILAVTAVNTAAPRTSLTHPKTLLHEFKSCKTAYLAVGAHFPAGKAAWPQTSLLTMTHRREGKESLVWASYLARFLGSHITIAHPDYRDADLRMRWRNNMRFVDKMFVPFSINYTNATAFGNDLKNMEALQPDLLIARTTDTRERDLFDLLLPLPEYRLLSHPSHTPVLFLNPRDDLYILCD